MKLTSVLPGDASASLPLIEPCPETYPHHPHVWLRGYERSISDAPQCQGIPNNEGVPLHEEEVDQEA